MADISVRIAFGAALALSIGRPGFAATPLPADSTAPNGVAQTLPAHKSNARPPAALADPGGLHPDAATGLARLYSGAPVDVLTYHYDGLRTGWNQGETDLKPGNVGSKSFGRLAVLKVDGNVFAQPLVVSNFVMPDSTIHSVLVVVTGHDSVYAFDAQSYAVLWHVSLGHSQSTNDVGCGDVQPEYGISSTPVILRAGPGSATIYLVAATEPAPYSFHTQLHAIDLGTGHDVVAPVEIAPGAKLKNGGTIGFDPQNQWSRASLAAANGAIYVGIGSHCDNNAGAISGWLLRYDPTLKLQRAFNTIEASAGYELASIWMSGFAPAIDAAGNVFVVTGNGNYSVQRGAQGFGESALSISPDLKSLRSIFTPADYNDLNNYDADFGSGGIMLLPIVPSQAAPPLAVAMGKDSVLYLLDQTHLGGLQGINKGALQSLYVGGGGVWGGPAYFGGVGGGRVYYQTGGDVLRAYAVNTGAHPSLKDVADGSTGAGYGGSLPIVSSNGAGDGVVWLIRRGDTVQLEAYDAVALGKPLFAANAGFWSNPGAGNSFLTPMEANGRVYVPAYRSVTVFGLTK